MSKAIELYVGPDKLKSILAFGEGIRYANDGNKVYMIQFAGVKTFHSCTELQKFEPMFKIFCFENQIVNSYNFAKKVLDTKQCDLLIIDEILTALEEGKIELDKVLKLIHEKPDNMRIIFTGNSVHPTLQNYNFDVVSVRKIDINKA